MNRQSAQAQRLPSAPNGQQDGRVLAPGNQGNNKVFVQQQQPPVQQRSSKEQALLVPQNSAQNTGNG